MHVYQVLQTSLIVVRGFGSDLVTKVIVHFPVGFAMLAVGPFPRVPPGLPPA